MSDAAGYRRAILAHLTSWVQNNTGVMTDPEATDSASLKSALEEVNGVVCEIEAEAERKPLGLEAAQLLVASELMLGRAAHHAGRGDLPAESQCLQAVAAMLDEGGSYFAEMAKECTECERAHASAGLFCLRCREPFIRNMPAEAQWFILYEDEAWHLRNGVGSQTLVFAYNTELGEMGEPEAKLWAADVMRVDYALSVSGWSPAWDGEPQYLTPDYWVATT
ncbi:hypothetical protein [Streptomyces sp. Midd1]|uniref:hypothetical protein n=1 Tax=Streptomyces sp. Midd3 TaxID=3161191 RepID=UPI0034DAD5EA